MKLSRLVEVIVVGAAGPNFIWKLLFPFGFDRCRGGQRIEEIGGVKARLR